MRRRCRESVAQDEGLVALVISFLGSRPQEIADCMLVCKSWREAARRVGFDNVWIAVPKTGSVSRIANWLKQVDPYKKMRRLDLHRSKADGNLVVKIFQDFPLLRHLRLVRLPHTSAVEEIIDSDRLETLSVVDCSNIRSKMKFGEQLQVLKLWQARNLRTQQLRGAVSLKLCSLAVSEAPLVGSDLLRLIKAIGPPLEELTLRNIGAFGPDEMAGALQAIQSTLRFLDFSQSVWFTVVPYYLFDSWFLAKLEYLVVDSTPISHGIEHLLSCCPNVRVLSLARSSGVTHEAFLEFQPLNLEVARLSGTNICLADVEMLRSLPKLKVLQVDACRRLQRHVRRQQSDMNRDHNLTEIAPKLLFSTFMEREEIMA